MNRNELIAQLAAETSTTRAAVERLAGAVFSAIGDALARGEPTAIAGFGTFAVRSRAARRRRNPREPESPSTSPPPGRRRSRPRRPFETRSTPSMAQAADRYRPRPATFVAGRSGRKFCVSSPVRTDAQSRAKIEFPRVRVPSNQQYPPLRSSHRRRTFSSFRNYTSEPELFKAAPAD